MTTIVAVVPTYNSADLVTERIRQLQQAGLTRIIVCDDASTDDTVKKIRKQFGNSVQLAAGTTNLGPGGNRNHCLDLLEAGDEIIFFLDADCELIYKDDLPELITKSFSSKKTGVVGFGMLGNGQPTQWNYGELMHPVHEAADQKLEEMLNTGAITKAQFITWAPARAASFGMLPEKTKSVGWVAEGCFAVRASVFKQLGGFDSNMRYHEAHDLNAGVQELGYQTIFNPTLVANHLMFDTRMHRRAADFQAGRFYYYQKHWGMSKEVFDHLFGE
jgi:GT2 family glycosyltransferase